MLVLKKSVLSSVGRERQSTGLLKRPFGTENLDKTWSAIHLEDNSNLESDQQIFETKYR
jgi:hypothetical protein